MTMFQDTRFTEYEIVQLWSTFQRDFPSGKINRVQITQLIKNVFPKYVSPPPQESQIVPI